MKKITLSVICAVALISLFDSCVAKKKFLEQRDRADANQKEINSLNARIVVLNDSLSSLSNTINAMNNRLKELGLEKEMTAALLNKTTSQLNQANSQLSQAHSQLNSTVDQLNQANSQLNLTKEQVEAQRQRMLQMQALLDQQQKAVEDLRKKITEALKGFNSSELTISMKNGRVYISMQESLLFPSGSAVVNPKGKEALSKVAAVLNNNSDININIEGHTDSIDIHNKMYSDNWALSVGRATSIARILIGDYKVSPTRLVASGRAFYDPIATNTTPAGRALNRRTEIILEPKLDELMQLMNADNTPKN